MAQEKSIRTLIQIPIHILPIFYQEEARQPKWKQEQKLRYDAILRWVRQIDSPSF